MLSKKVISIMWFFLELLSRVIKSFLKLYAEDNFHKFLYSKQQDLDEFCVQKVV